MPQGRRLRTGNSAERCGSLNQCSRYTGMTSSGWEGRHLGANRRSRRLDRDDAGGLTSFIVTLARQVSNDF